MPALTLTQLEDLFITATVAMTGLPIDSITLSYQPDSAPFSPQAVNHAYLYVIQVDSPLDKQTFSQLSPSTEQGGIKTQAYTRVMQCGWSFYGPGSYELADSIRNGILREDIRGPLSLAQVFPNPSITAPQRAPREMSANQWWERSDVKVRFNVTTSHDSIQPYFSAIRILLESAQRGLIATINIPPS